MPYRLKKNKDGSYRVVNIDKNTIKAKHTTKKRGESQIKLLEWLDQRKKKGCVYYACAFGYSSDPGSGTFRNACRSSSNTPDSFWAIDD